MSETNKVKQVIVVRYKYLNEKGQQFSLRTGKIAAQAAHAAMSFLTRKIQNSTGKVKLSKAEEEWVEGSFAKVCVRVDSEEQLLEIYQKAKDAMLEVHLITDSGLTEFHGVPTKTCLAIGPDYSSNIDPITGSLQLL